MCFSVSFCQVIFIYIFFVLLVSLCHFVKCIYRNATREHVPTSIAGSYFILSFIYSFTSLVFVNLKHARYRFTNKSSSIHFYSAHHRTVDHRTQMFIHTSFHYFYFFFTLMPTNVQCIMYVVYTAILVRRKA